MPRIAPSGPTAPGIPDWHLYGEQSAFPDLLHIETITDRAAGLDWQIDAHRHPHLHQFFLIQDGEVTIGLDGETLRQRPPVLLNVPSGVVHGFRFAAGTSGWVLTLPIQTLPELLDPSASGAIAAERAAVLHPTAEMESLFRQIDVEHAGLRPARSAMLRALAAQLACLVLRSMDNADSTGRNRPDPRFQRFQTLIGQHLRDQWRLPDYAREIGVSERHLSRICRAMSGRPAAEIIEAALIREACRLLA
jgi:AraC family transcriptional activator of pobA